MHELDKSEAESYDDRVEGDFIDFIQEKDFSADEMRTAYYQICGISETEATTERQVQLLTEMRAMVDDRYPLNRFSKLIEKMDSIDYAVKDYESFVNDLEITDKEKGVLISIVEKNRTGELEFHLDSEPIISVSILKNGSAKITAFKLLQQLPRLLNKVSGKGGELSIQFSEE